MSAWQTIDTAPRDGSWFQLWDGNRVQEACWDEPGQCWVDAGERRLRFVYDHAKWQPMAAPPAEEVGG